MMAMWGADTLVAASAKARMNSCYASSKTSTAEGDTTEADTSSKTACSGYNGSGCHNRGSSCN